MAMHVVMTSSAKPKGRFGRYGNVAVVQLNQEYTAKNWRPKMISEHAKGVLRIVRHYGRRSMGKTERCDYAMTLKAAEELAYRLNNVPDLADIEAIIGAGGSA
jgi:hypothetical protein